MKKIMILSLGQRGAGPVLGFLTAKSLFNIMANKNIILLVSKKSELKIQENVKFKIIKTKTISYNVFKLFLNIKNILKIIAKEKPNIILYPMLHPFSFIILIAFPNIKFISIIHDVKFHLGENKNLLLFVNKLIMRNASKILFYHSKFFINNERNIKLRKKIYYIPLGDLNIFENFVKTSQKKSNTIMFFGRIRKYKGLEVLLKAYKLLKMELNDINLLIVGSGNIKKYEKYINGDKSIEIINKWIKNEEIPLYFEKAKVLVLPYIDASQSGVFVLASRFKVPVIATNVSGLKEQIIHNETGLLINPNNIVDLKDSIKRILKDEKLYMFISNNAYKKNLENNNWEKIGNNIKDIINEKL